MKSLIVFLSIFMYITACGNSPADQATTKQTANLNSITSIAQIKALYDQAVASKDSSALAAYVSQVDTLFVVPVSELRKKDIGLTPGFGEAYIKYAPIDSSSFDAANNQKVVHLTNQGIAMLHNFHYIDAVRSFENAVKLAPDYVDAKIFLAMSYPQFSGDINGYISAAKVLAEAAALPMNTVQNAWFKFTEAYLFSGGAFGMQSAYRKLLLATNSDNEALSLAGWVSNLGGKAAYLEVLKSNPNHVGANHYMVHMHEFSNEFKEAEKYGEVLAQISPKGAHAQHMYGHVLPMVKKLDESIKQFEITNQLHRDWAKANNWDPNYDWHYSHNNHLLGIAYLANDEAKNAEVALTEGCKADFRSCDGLAKMAVMRLDSSLIDIAKRYAKIQVSASEEVAVEAYFNRYLAEISYITGSGTDKNQILQLANSYQDNVLQVIALLDGLQAGSGLYNQILTVIDSFFTGGGFDSWTNGFPNAMRVRVAAQKFGIPELVTYIDGKVAQIK